MGPYREGSSPNDADADAREVQDFATKMHADRRVWGNEHLGQAVLGGLMGSAILLIGVGTLFLSRSSSDPWGALILTALALGWLALAVHKLVAWRRDVERMRHARRREASTSSS